MKFSIVRTDRNKATHLTVKSVEWFMERILTDTKAGDVCRLRQHVAYCGNGDGYDKYDTIAKVYPAAVLRKAENGGLEIEACNNLVTLHVADLLREEDRAAVKESAKQLPLTLAAFEGADGRSVEILVAVDDSGNGRRPMSEAEMDAFCKKAYETAVSVYSGLLPYPIERQAVSVRSHFLLPLDPVPYYNPSPTPLKITATSHLTPFRQAGEADAEENTSLCTLHSSLAPDLSLYALYEQMYERAAEEAVGDVTEVADEQRTAAFITALVRRLCEKGVPEEETFLHLRNHYAYNKSYDEDTFRAIVAAVFAETKPRRQGNCDTVSRDTRRLISFLTTRYVFRSNTVMGYTEYRPNNTWTQDWQPCDENVINGMTIEARLANLDVRDKDVRRYVRSNMIRPCDPIGDYMLRVSDMWDGQTDHIAMLARQVPCNLPHWERWFRKWFLSMVAQWLLPGQEYGNSVVPLLISAQGDGKTTFCRNILPGELRWGFLENLDVSEKRQTLQAMHNFLLINLDEFNQIPPKLQEGFLKNVIQLPSVKLKRPYGKHVEEFRRYASFIATTNEGSVLSDPTGNRRFICVQLSAPINTAYRPNYEALYGQAYTIIMQRHEQWWFTTDEVKSIMENNRHFEVTPPAIQYFNEYYGIARDESDGQWLSPTAIYDRLRRLAGSGLRANGVAAFGRYLKNIPGLQQRRITTGRLYLVYEK